MFQTLLLSHSALKLEKKCKNNTTCVFKNGKKSIFASEKSPKLAFLIVLNFFLVKKLIFCHFWNSKKCVFCTFEIAHFSKFRAPKRDANYSNAGVLFSIMISLLFLKMQSRLLGFYILILTCFQCHSSVDVWKKNFNAQQEIMIFFLIKEFYIFAFVSV